MDRKPNVVREGLQLGLIGYVAVAAFYALFDVLAGRGPTFTLNLMGKVVFRGARDPALLQLPIASDVGAMVAYNFLHLFVALAVGLFVMWIVHRIEDRPGWLMAGLGLLLAGYVATILVIRIFTRDVAPLMPFWSIVIVNSLVALGGAVFLWNTHPRLWRTR